MKIKVWKRLRATPRLLIAMGCLLALLLTSCACRAIETLPPALNETEVRIMLPADAEHCFELYGDAEACFNYLRQACEGDQEFLVMVMSAFTQALRDHDVELVDPQILDQQLDFFAGEQVTTEAVRAALDDVLAAEAISSGVTEVTFGSWQGYGVELYRFQRDVTNESLTDSDPKNYGLMPVPVCLDGHPVMVVTHTYADGTKETGYFDLYAGFQRILLSDESSIQS